MHNFFEILALKESFTLDKSSLESNNFEALSKYHPDKASDSDKSKHAELSSIINTAYEKLGNDFERAAHILELHGINIKSDSTAPKLPLDLLHEILEMQEALEDPDKKDYILAKCKEKNDIIISELGKLFDAKDYESASIKAMHLKYLAKALG